MQDRQANLLAEIVRLYIQGAEPVGSKTLAGSLAVSSATVRHEMAELEAMGYLYQPHTSAGRVPTIKGYQYYIDNFIKAVVPDEAEQKVIRQIVAELAGQVEVMTKTLAKKLAYYSTQAAVVGFSPYDVYYTGLANLFNQPEFCHIDMVRSIGQVIDHLDEGMSQLYRAAPGQAQVRIGDNNPWGDNCAIIFTSFPLGQKATLLGLLGPLRMDYNANLGRLNYVRGLFVK